MSGKEKIIAVKNAVKYADYAIERFIELAKKELDLWLFQNGFEDIQVETINDDFSNISIPQINSAQMAYPESSMLSLMRYSTTFAKLIDNVEAYFCSIKGK